MHTTADQQVLIASPSLEAFDLGKTRCCRACGLETGTWANIVAWIRGGHANTHAIGWCPGGKEPTQPRSLVAAMMTGHVDSVNPCAGIEEPHLHLRCNVCGFFFLMATKSPSLRAV